MKTLVTGGTGFVGSHLVRALLKLGCEVFVIGSRGEIPVPKGVHFFSYSYAGVDWARMHNLLNGDPMDVIFHLAADNDTTVTNTDDMWFTNVKSSMVLFEHAISMGCKKIIYASSAAVYGNTPPPHRESGPTDPLNAYGKSKKHLEEIAHQFDDKSLMGERPLVVTIGLRYCNIYGPGEAKKGKRASMIYQLAQQIRKGPPRLFGDGEQKRDYIFIDDVIRANLLAMEVNDTCVINIATGEATSFNKLVSILRMTVPTDIDWDETEYVPNPYEGAYQSHTQCDMTVAKEILGFVPKYDISRGIAEYYKRGELSKH